MKKIRKNCLVLDEFDDNQKKYWFDLKNNNFVHNIDTFYYSIKLSEDFTEGTHDKKVIRFRRYIQSILSLNYDEARQVGIEGCDDFVATHSGYGKYYSIRISSPELFDFFVAPVVPPGADGGQSVTSEIIVQLRSYLLWMSGPQEAFKISLEKIKVFLDYFDLHIYDIKENRIDYCWHSNYLENPEKFFNIENFVKMQVSHFRGVSYHYSFRQNLEYENDYVALGKRSDKIFVRIYLKSKEVVEMGYKPWFIKYWYDHKLISLYDEYVLEEAYLANSWKYCETARLKWYSEYGSNPKYVNLCKQVIENHVITNYQDIAALADKLTPRITKIMNVEFQTMRKGTKNYILIPQRTYSDSLTERVDMYFDNWPLVTEYLTHSVLRLVDVDENVPKTKCDYNNFWKMLRAASSSFQPECPEDQKLLRDYSRKLNSDLVKRRALHSIVSYGFYVKGINEDSPLDDCMNALLRLNDNDMVHMSSYKIKKAMTLNKKDFDGQIDDEKSDLILNDFVILNKNTGELYESE